MNLSYSVVFVNRPEKKSNSGIKFLLSQARTAGGRVISHLPGQILGLTKSHGVRETASKEYGGRKKPIKKHSNPFTF